MANVVVTGGAGFIGSHLVDALVAQQHSVTVVDNLVTGKKRNLHKRAIFRKLDIRDFPLLHKAFRRADYVYHLAALPRIQRSVDNPLETSAVNIQGTLNVLEAARRSGVKKVIFSSSSSVYGKQNSFPLKECMNPNPLSPYALQKLAGEWYCRLYSELYNLQTVTLRFFSVYGPRQNETETHATIIAKFRYLRERKRPLLIYGDGEQTRDFTHVYDVVSACISVLDSAVIGRGQIYNVCTGSSRSMNEIARLIGGATRHAAGRKGETRDIVGDNNALFGLTGWKPRHSLEEYLRTDYA